MSKDAFYFQHDYEPTSDPKIQAMLGEFGATGYGLYWRMVEMLHSDSNHKLPTKQYIFMGLAKQMETKVELVSLFVKQCIEVYELFNSDGISFWSERVLRNIEKRSSISEKRSFAGKKSAEKKAKNLTDVQHLSTNAEHLSTSVEQNSTKERKGKKRKVKENILKEEGATAPEQKILNDFEKRQNNFYETLEDHLPTYGKDMLRKFYDYWREPNKSKTQMRFEQEKTWDIDLRLKRWASNDFSKDRKEDPSPSGPTPSELKAQRILNGETV